MYNDTKEYIDRIFKNISNLSYLKAGALIEILKLHNNTLSDMKYIIIEHKKGWTSSINGHLQPVYTVYYGLGQCSVVSLGAAGGLSAIRLSMLPISNPRLQ